MSDTKQATDDRLRRLAAEMRTIQMVAGQCAAEGYGNTQSMMASAEADRCAKWADALEAALRAPEASRPPDAVGASLGERSGPAMADAAEMLWLVLANVSGGDWTQQSPEWQETAARWRDYYFTALNDSSADRRAAQGL